MVRKAWWRHVVLLLALVLVASACSGVQVNVRGGTSHAIKNRPADGSSDLAIVGVDFDPPLDYVDSIRRNGIMLLVAVENRGDVPMSGVRIHATLRYGRDEQEVLKRSGILPTLVPHRIVVYRFPRMRRIPVRQSYTLHIRLLSPGGTRVLSEREYIIDVVRQDKEPTKARR